MCFYFQNRARTLMTMYFWQELTHLHDHKLFCLQRIAYLLFATTKVPLN